jgi:hypothetical protein
MLLKRVLLTLVLFILASVPFAKSSEAVIVITPQIGLNASQFTSDPDSTEDSIRPGWQIGGYLRLGQDNLYIQPGIFWYRISTKLETGDSNQESNAFESTIDSIQIPVMVGWNIVNSGAFNLRLQGGGGVNITTGVDESVNVDKDNVNDTNFLLKAAVGADIAIFTVDLGYDAGITNYLKDEDSKLHSIVFNLGLRFWI